MVTVNKYFNIVPIFDDKRQTIIQGEINMIDVVAWMAVGVVTTMVFDKKGFLQRVALSC